MNTAASLTEQVCTNLSCSITLPYTRSYYNIIMIFNLISALFSCHTNMFPFLVPAPGAYTVQVRKHPVSKHLKMSKMSFLQSTG